MLLDVGYKKSNKKSRWIHVLGFVVFLSFAILFGAAGYHFGRDYFFNHHDSDDKGHLIDNGGIVIDNGGELVHYFVVNPRVGPTPTHRSPQPFSTVPDMPVAMFGVFIVCRDVG